MTSETEKLKERIKFKTEILKLFVILMIATGGGSLSLIMKGLDYARDGVLAAFGMIFSIVCLVVTYVQYHVTQRLIDSL